MDAPSPESDSSLDASRTSDAISDSSAAHDAPGVACGTSWDTLFMDWGQAPWDGGYRFASQGAFEAFFVSMAQLDGLVVPAHDVDCGPDGATCTYDPTQPRLSPQDIHYSDALHQFIGPNGHPYVWSYLTSLNEWVLVDQTTSPQSYQLLVTHNAGCMAGCECDAGGG
jgi:hypothetical protein